MSKRARDSRGFTLAEVIVSITLVAILAAVVVPTVRGRFQDGYETALVQEFTTLSAGVNAFRQDVGKYPLRLDYLTALPAQGTAQDYCGHVISTADYAKWRGPYVSRTITNANYVIAESDTVQFLFYQSAPTNTIQIQIVGVDAKTALDIDLKIDGANDRLNGTIQYAPAGQAQEIRYIIPIRTNGC